MINRYYVVDILSQEPLSDVQTAILQYIAQHAATKYRIGKDLNIKSYSTVFNNVNQLLDADYIQIVKHGTRHAIYYGLTVTGLREIIADTNTVAGQIQLLLRHHRHL